MRQTKSIKRRVMIALAGVLLCGVSEAQAANHYVRQGASGAANGNDWTNAYTTLPSALVRGDVYYVAAGTYGGYTFDDATSGTTVTTVKKATIADHGTATGWSDAFGTGVASFNGQLNFASSYWLFDGVTGGGPGSWTSGFGFKVTNTDASPALLTAAVTQLTIRHVEVVGNNGSNQGGGGQGNDGIASWGGTKVTLSYYYIHDMGRCIFFLSAQDFIAEYGYTGSFTSTSATHAEVASIWGFQIPSNRLTFRYSVFAHVEGTGGLVFDNHENPTGGGMEVYGNVFYRPSNDTWDDANGVIAGWTGANAEEFHDVHVYNNTFINVNIASLSEFPRVYSGNIARNNLFYNSRAPGFGVFTTHDSNHFINSGGTQGEPNGTSAASGDPFVDYVNLDFRLKAPTASGASLPAPFTSDMFGATRGADGVRDRGAVEFSSTSSSLPPIAPLNVRVLQ
jgi:hypothetical protein